MLGSPQTQDPNLVPFYAAIIQNVAIPVLSCIHRSPQLRSAYTYLQDNFESVFRGVFSTSRCFTHSLITLYCEYLLLIGSVFPQSGMFSQRKQLFERIEHSDRMGSFMYSQIIQLRKIQESPDVERIFRSLRVTGSVFSGMTHPVKYYVSQLNAGGNPLKELRSSACASTARSASLAEHGDPFPLQDGVPGGAAVHCQRSVYASAVLPVPFPRDRPGYRFRCHFQGK